MLDDAKLCRPGCERTSSISSATERTGELALITSWIGVDARLVIPRKSLSGSCDIVA